MGTKDVRVFRARLCEGALLLNVSTVQVHQKIESGLGCIWCT